MSADTEKLGNAAAGFGLAAAVTALFNTALACTKDAYHPLNIVMNRIAGHNWTTQGLADVALFLGLGLVLWKTGWAGRVPSIRLISFLTVAVVVAGVGLFTWYALF